MSDIKSAHERIDKIESTVNGHGEMIKALSINQKEQYDALQENTQLTKTIADNTDELVTLVKGSKLFYKLIIGIGTLVGIFYSFWIFLRSIK